MRPTNDRYSVRRVVTGFGLCSLSTGTLTAIALLVVFRILLGDCDITCDVNTPGAHPNSSGTFQCNGVRSVAV